ncbi:TIR-like protein FxsC [Streptacidiphilus sp. N1-10]|uniref:TIR-like protein FxsC n=1 Tax=Streptacidiphilus jeojiensis TaxID=3229225 RepID=A0ABV6XYW2_9ACTN
MSDQGSWDEDIPRPFFFLSYAHSPRGAGRAGPVAHHWEDRLFHDLSEAVGELAGLADNEPAGFMDRGLKLGDGWSAEITEALAHCRAFVPLYSPRYFRSQACGQEWSAFASREVLPRNRTSGHASGVVPVQWVSVRHELLPPVARALQFNHRDFGEEYVEEGLQTLLKARYFRTQYELAVHRLAQRIVQVGLDTAIRLGGRRDFQDQRSAFEPPDRRRSLHITVLACDRKSVPEGRSPDSYGINAVDWQPFGEDSDSSIAKRAAAIARQWDFHPTVHDLAAEDVEAAEADGAGPPAPSVLLLDRWALLHPDRRALLQRLDAQNPLWMALLEPWDADDPECNGRQEELRRLADEVLLNLRADRRRRPGADTLSSLAEFEEALPRAALVAMHAFDDWRRRAQGSPERTGPAKPTLRESTARGAQPSRGTPGGPSLPLRLAEYRPEPSPLEPSWHHPADPTTLDPRGGADE